MARGSVAKTLIGTAILQVFPGSFIDSDGKTIRIPSTAEGDPLEIKVTLTAAKDIVGGSGAPSLTENSTVQPQNTAMTTEEIEEVKRLIKDLNL